MKTFRFFALSVAAALLFAGAENFAAVPAIAVQDGGWGSASVREIHALALATATEIGRHCPKTRIGTIVVHHRDDHPQTAWVRTADGKIIVGIEARDRQCAQFVFQFAHEFCHVLATQANDWQRTWREAGKPNLWLEESFAEAASLFALRTMSRSWERSAPFRNWRAYAPEFAAYAEDRMRATPAVADFARWFRQNEPAMRRNATLRASNSVVASRLLPLLEAEPRAWEAVTFMNLGAHDRKMPLSAFFAEWRQNCPPKLQPFIAKVAQVFGIAL
ncbi:MAG: hypothetical protein WCK55_07690 [Verrucomicrobiota bacterium]